MKPKIARIMSLHLVTICIFILYATICFGADEKDSQVDKSVKTYKINLNPLVENKAESEAKNEDQPVQDPPQEETQPQTEPSLPPLREIVFVIDNSGSMKQNDPNRITKEVVAEFIGKMDTESRIAMVIFDTDAQVLRPLTKMTGEAAERELIDALNQLDYRGQLTNTPTGIERAIYELKINGNENAAKMIILLTDGIIDTGDATENKESERWLKEDLVAQCQALDIKIFGIAFTDKADYRLMQILASKTKGEYYRVYQAEEIEGVLDSINDQILRLALTPPAAESMPSSVVIEEKKQIPEESSAITEESAQKMPTLRTEPAEPPAPVSTPPVATGRSFMDTFPIIFLMAVILVVLILLLLMFKSNRGIPADASIQSGKDERAEEKPPNVQAELIDVEHIIPQDSISLTIQKSSVSIGRDPHNDIVIPEKVVSSLHATISFKNGQYYLEDNRSTNGTRLNNQVIDQNIRVKLKSGDIIHFAKCEFRFLVHDQAPYGETMLINAD